MKNYRYDMIGAYIAGVKLHPQEDMARLGFNVIKSEGVPIADCWLFRVDNDIKELPKYIEVISDGCKFSDE